MIKPGRQFCQVLGPIRGDHSVMKGKIPLRVPLRTEGKRMAVRTPFSLRGVGKIEKDTKRQPSAASFFPVANWMIGRMGKAQTLTCCPQDGTGQPETKLLAYHS
jgi:hypothetical protein